MDISRKGITLHNSSSHQSQCRLHQRTILVPPVSSFTEVSVREKPPPYTMKLQLAIALLSVIFIIDQVFASSCDLLTLDDFEEYAKDRLPKGLLEYLQRGADKDETLRRNSEAFSRIRVLPRYLRDISNRTTEATALNKTFKLPIGISPSGLHKRWHPEGELATVRAAAQAGTIMIVSAASSVSLEDIAAESPEAEKWFQMFIFKNYSITEDLIRRAENANYSAIVITVDMPVPALRYHNQRNQWKDQYQMVNMIPYEHADPDGKKRDSATWADLKTIVTLTKLPVIVKGISTPEDARLAHTHGAKGIIVSNHGGRQLDGSVSTIEALSRIIHDFPEASYKGFEIYLDGGIRSGLDVFKAFAIGAKFVFVGRPAAWGLFHSGQQGLEAVLEILRSELETVMAQTGCVTVDHINKYLVTPLPEFW